MTFASPSGLYWVPADGSGQPERLAQSDNARPGSWSPDGKTLAFFETAGQTLTDLLTLTLDGDRKPQVFLRTPARESYPEFSPDGRWLAYQSDETGRHRDVGASLPRYAVENGRSRAAGVRRRAGRVTGGSWSTACPTDS